MHDIDSMFTHDGQYNELYKHILTMISVTKIAIYSQTTNKWNLDITRRIDILVF